MGPPQDKRRIWETRNRLHTHTLTCTHLHAHTYMHTHTHTQHTPHTHHTQPCTHAHHSRTHTTRHPHTHARTQAGSTGGPEFLCEDLEGARSLAWVGVAQNNETRVCSCEFPLRIARPDQPTISRVTSMSVGDDSFLADYSPPAHLSGSSEQRALDASCRLHPIVCSHVSKNLKIAHCQMGE
jgi:hypothetical protein